MVESQWNPNWLKPTNCLLYEAPHIEPRHIRLLGENADDRDSNDGESNRDHC